MTLATKFGRYSISETPSSLDRLHWYGGAPLHEVDHEPKVAVLDQEDLIAQGIIVSEFIPGAPKSCDALGSCTAQAFTAGLSNLTTSDAEFAAACAKLGATVTSYTDTTGAEKFAIVFYTGCTHQTGSPSQEWPPTDCGSSGPYVVEYAQRLGLISGEHIAHGAQNIVSLLQADGLIVGQPFFNAWMTPDANGFIDGNGSSEALQKAIKSGVAGGHETYLSAVEKLVLSATGQVDPQKTIIRFRNSWTKSWGDNGSYRAHLSTYTTLGNHCDFRQLVA